MIAPDTEYWKFFFGPDSEKVNYGDIGLWEDLQFTFTVPSTAPTYVELRTEADKFDLSKVPYKFEVTQSITVSCVNWASSVTMPTTFYRNDKTSYNPIHRFCCPSSKKRL